MLNFLWGMVSLPRAVSCARAFGNVEQTQQRVLLRVIRDNQRSVFGKEHGFACMRTAQDFIAKVPIATYDSYVPYVERIMRGEAMVLTREPVFALEPTSGSASPSKYIPYTLPLLRQFQNGIAPWIVDLFLHRPGLMAGSAYWSITPVRRGMRKTSGGVPVGLKDDSGYFGALAQRLIGCMRAVPAEVAEIDDMQSFRYVTLLFLLKDKALSLISVWNPTFLKLLLQPMVGWAPSLLADLSLGMVNPPGTIREDLRKKLRKALGMNSGRARELKSIFDRWYTRGSTIAGTQSMYQEIWPCVSLISCWTDGAAARFVQDVRAFFPRVEIQPKGLLATEGFVSFPSYAASGAVLAITSHFFEFIEVDGCAAHDEGRHIEPKLAHQLQLGKTYSVVVTTAGGLCRYRLCDTIEVTGFVKASPLIRFKGKQDCVSDLCGEKLHEYHVGEVLKEAFTCFQITPQFFLMAPGSDGGKERSYVLFLQLLASLPVAKAVLGELGLYIDTKLQENYHYHLCRELGQLQSLRIFLIPATVDPAREYLLYYHAQGQRLGQIKIPVLDKSLVWEKVFQGNLIESRRISEEATQHMLPRTC